MTKSAIGSVFLNREGITLIIEENKWRYLANHDAPKAATGRPLKLCDAIFLVWTNRAPERRNTLSVLAHRRLLRRSSGEPSRFASHIPENDRALPTN